jgi:hypothetical protein
MSILKGLGPGVQALIKSESFRSGLEPYVEAGAFLEDVGIEREISLEPLRTVINAATVRFPNPEKSDAWLAPRVHAALRLTRREAADKRIWTYLTVVAFPDYVRWRWFKNEESPDKPVPLDRFTGEDSKNGIARLWWAAELTRNGKDYARTVQALKTTRFAVSWQHLDCIHHRAAALAVVTFLDEFGEKGATDDQRQKFAKTFNLALTTLSLDSLCENGAVDAEAIREWCNETIDETILVREELPEGPDEEQVPEEAITCVRAVLQRLADEIDLANFKAKRRRRRTDKDLPETDESASNSERVGQLA